MGDTQQGRISKFKITSLCFKPLKTFPRLLCFMPAAKEQKYCQDPRDKLVLKEAFQVPQPFPRSIPCCLQGQGSCSQSTREVVLVGGRRHRGRNGMNISRRKRQPAASVCFFQTAESGQSWNPHYLNHLNISWIQALKKILQSIFLPWQAVDWDDLISLFSS